MKALKKILITLISLVLIFAIGFVGYLELSFYRIGDSEIAIGNNQTDMVAIGEIYTIATYNIGFGAYDREYSFFMDKGYMADGSETVGKYGKGTSYDNVMKNTTGSIDILRALATDFMILQEVDTRSSRSYKINQRDMILEAFSEYSYTYAENFHSAFLPYPLHDMHGIVNSGILTASRFNMAYSYRYELPIDESFFNKFFDLDRCVNLVRYDIRGTDKQHAVFSVHLSAYDEGGVYRAMQIELLRTLMTAEYEKGNYVIVGGDFNHDIAEGGSDFPTEQLTPDWLKTLEGDEFGEHFQIVCDNARPTCRDADIPWVEGVTYATVIDGFIISDNIELITVKTIDHVLEEDTNFLYSDHNPVVMSFKLR